MAADTIQYTGELTVLTCWCGIIHAVPTSLWNEQVSQHDNGQRVMSIYCPLGHGHVPSGRGRADIERERAEWFERQLANRHEDLRAERAAHAATKGKLTKTRNRVAKGVCPCCNRSFVNVARHMAGQHPDYAAT